MSFHFRPAKREDVGLLIAFAGPSGSGKTYSALELATGLAAGKRFCVLDTEARRALHYADQFDFDHGDLEPPFNPGRYLEAIQAADAEGYPVIVIDSASHEWSGEGGVLEMQEAELDRMAGKDWAKRERVKLASWIKPKREHKKLVFRMLQTRAHLIFCLRAEEKTEAVKDQRGKLQIVSGGWQPICEKNFMYEMVLSILLSPEKPGVPIPIKLQAQHREMLPVDRPVSRTAGEALASWARGGDGTVMQHLRNIDPPYHDTVQIKAVRQAKTRKGLRYGVECSDGKTYGTYDEGLADECASYCIQKVAIKVKAERRGKAWDLLGITPVLPESPSESSQAQTSEGPPEPESAPEEPTTAVEQRLMERLDRAFNEQQGEVPSTSQDR